MIKKKTSIFSLEDLLVVAVTVVSLGIVGWAATGGHTMPTVTHDAVVISAADRPDVELPPATQIVLADVNDGERPKI